MRKKFRLCNILSSFVLWLVTQRNPFLNGYLFCHLLTVLFFLSLSSRELTTRTSHKIKLIFWGGGLTASSLM